jgi:transposase-like protein
MNSWLYAAIDTDSKLLLGVRVSCWPAASAFYYSYQRPNQALDDRTPVEEVAND